jgi:hypothetical protein
MTIEERADKYAADRTHSEVLRGLLREAYLAGSAQTQKDYSADVHERRAVAEGWPPYGWAT